MSVNGIEAVLARAMEDATFVDALFTDADKALSGFDLTAEEITKFKGMSRTAFDAFAKASPEERKSMTSAAWGRV